MLSHRSISLISSVVWLCCVLSCFETILGQTETKWQGLSSKKGEISVVFPSNIVAVNEGDEIKIYSSVGGANFKLEKAKVNDPEDYVRSMKNEGVSGKVEMYVKNKVTVRQLSYENADAPSYHFYIATPKSYFYLSGSAESGNDQNLLKFMRSLKFNGEPLFVDPFESQGADLIIEDMQSSPIVKEYLRKPDSTDMRLFIGSTAKPSTTDISKSKGTITRSFILLTKPKARFELSGPPLGYENVRVLILFKSDGQVGSATFESKVPQVAGIVRAIQGLRFIPQEIDGKPADMYKTFEYHVPLYK